MLVNRRSPACAGRALLAAFFVAEGRLRQGQAARSFSAGDADRGTTKSIGMAFAVAGLAGPSLASVSRGRLPSPVGWVGVAVMGAGLSLRVWSARTLGACYTRTLRVEADQPVVEAGPYAYVRHPGYAGVTAMWVGYGLALTSLPAVAATTVPMLVAYHRRIAAEETMLTNSLGDPYRAYQQRTARLIPRIY
ncbi:isoprenylcysteine carboxylmethyltransferase family protein [Frankia sp. Cas4]|uniref:methyltransferase family protein n=1 Tax=Frankia sp. Cas4 TaxID=3073927 RepID=UPI002AD3FB8D|nr:isoprenylcysteine carboxylmethyltransferase family protein [Frankia sp. Cas4]